LVLFVLFYQEKSTKKSRLYRLADKAAMLTRKQRRMLYGRGTRQVKMA
jgi:hypothetical protein